MKKLLYIVFGIAIGTVLLTGCVSRGNDQGWEYAPDMYYSKGYEPYHQGDSHLYNPLGINMREPVYGTVALGKLDYAYPFENTQEGYDAAGKTLDYPKDLTDNDCRGEYLFNIYCSPCHGKEGKNDGQVFSHGLGKPPWPAYTDKYIQDLPVGSIYHVLTYGKNAMGSHASVLTPVDRWRVIKWVKKLSTGDVSPCAKKGGADNAVSAGTVVKLEAKEQSELEELLHAINFETGSDKLTAASMVTIEKIAAICAKHPELIISVEGHTDNSGDAAKNKSLSGMRAASVVAQLKSKGVKNELTSAGFGSEKPIADNNTAEGKAKNRRVEIIFKK